MEPIYSLKKAAIKSDITRSEAYESKLGDLEIELRVTLIRSKSPVFKYFSVVAGRKQQVIQSGLSRNMPCLIASI